MSDLNKAHLKEILPERYPTFVDIGTPSNIIKTAVIMNLMLFILTFTLMFIPIPFFGVIIVIIYINSL